MSKRRTTKYEHGDRYQVYINRTVDDELLSFINKQSDISGASMLGLILLYQMYGNTDIDDLLPRNYRVNAHIPNFNNNVPISIHSNEVIVPEMKNVSSENEIDSLKDTGRAEEIIIAARPVINKEEESSSSEDIKIIESNSLGYDNESVSPVQNEVSEENNERIPTSKGNGLNSIKTSSMMPFGNMIKPKKGK
ncbi:hypothetical protein [Lysinibacillus fusiformis]|uniref:hypothetical protein n=1 Tax=Lysinibacillus fusiformis TaxID=28031 RepID=UPI00088B5513|nr:hypothetical protein [Lysinibacillus fusiformis]SCX63167.1 hypothetical protein SAMN02787108_03195 [Lysinibacillus fusiformis]SDB45780.1 hypothetical protein SAMN02787070_03390 [Lysinibacillus fusiformis]SFI71303.1 hypothetical protein SAMN02787080_03408 [Lysinibacillus fusiformis]SFT14940.1 hypothetical protein SAMN02787099_03110 [Lysinibacillus fusiformis]